jgi:hypothetical protein
VLVTLWLRVRLVWNRIKMAYTLHRLSAARKTAETILDRARAKYPELFKEE